MATERTHLMLAIDVDSDPISGLVSNGTEVSTPFSGWIELVSWIEAARRAELAGAARSHEDTGVQTLGTFPGAKVGGL